MLNVFPLTQCIGPLPSVDNTTPSPSASTLKSGDSTPSPSSPALALEAENATLAPPYWTPKVDDSSSALQVEDGGTTTDTATEGDAATADEGVGSANPGIPSATTYFNNACNAYFTASSGGVHRTLATLGQAEESHLSMLEERNPSVGRGLFVAIDVELDASGAYLQAGYAASLWTDPEAPEDSSPEVDDNMPEMKEVLRRKHWR